MMGDGGIFMVGVKQLELKCLVEKKVFDNKETGEKFDYLSFNVVVDGQHIKLSVPKESKQLLNYLLLKHFDKT